MDGEAKVKRTHFISSKTSQLSKRNKACAQLTIIQVGKGESVKDGVCQRACIKGWGLGGSVCLWQAKLGPHFLAVNESRDAVMLLSLSN